VATDSYGTAYHAIVTEGKVSASSKIAVIGLGGLGLAAIQIASHIGAAVYGIDVHPTKYVAAIQSGAISCAKSVEGFPGARFDTVFDFAGAGMTTAAAVKAVKPGGKVILVGLGSKKVTIDTYDFIAMGVTLKGSAGSALDEVKEVLKLIAEGHLNPLLEEIPFVDIAKGLERLTRGEVVGRLYADPSKV
jgi:propanol-preferring alcohol dehydrogenase